MKRSRAVCVAGAGVLTLLSASLVILTGMVVGLWVRTYEIPLWLTWTLRIGVVIALVYLVMTWYPWYFRKCNQRDQPITGGEWRDS